jgi:hypothetical protein
MPYSPPRSAPARSGGGYTRLATSENEAVPAARSPVSPLRSVAILTGMGILAVVYVITTARSATTSAQGGKREVTLFGRYEKFKLQTENSNLRDKIAQLQAQLDQGDSKKMAAARSAIGDGSSLAPQVPSPALVRLPVAAAGGASSPSLLESAATAPPARTGDALDRTRFRLTKELIRSRCNEHNIILVTFVNCTRAGARAGARARDRHRHCCCCRRRRRCCC